MTTMKRIPLHSRVALKDGADNVYSLALSGTEGWVRDHRVDDDGFEMVAIEWDPDHWRYNGQPDGWTFASHFRVVGPPEPPTNEPVFEDDDELPEPGPTDEQIEEYVDAITDAMDAASESEGFFMLTIRRMHNPEDPNQTMFVPQIFMQATTREAEVLIDVQLLECASSSMQQAAMAALERYRGEPR